MKRIVAQDANRHSSSEVNEYQTPHSDGDGEFNAQHVGQTQTDGVRPQPSEPHQQDGKDGAKHQRFKSVCGGVGEPSRAEERHEQEQEQHDGAVVNIAHQQVVLLSHITAFGALALPLSQRQ